MLEDIDCEKIALISKSQSEKHSGITTENIARLIAPYENDIRIVCVECYCECVLKQSLNRKLN